MTGLKNDYLLNAVEFYDLLHLLFNEKTVEKKYNLIGFNGKNTRARDWQPYHGEAPPTSPCDLSPRLLINNLRRN